MCMLSECLTMMCPDYYSDTTRMTLTCLVGTYTSTHTLVRTVYYVTILTVQ